MKRLYGIGILCLFLALILGAGCTIQQNISGVGDRGAPVSEITDTTMSGSPVVRDTVTIRIRDSSFDPPSITVPTGTTVVWINEDVLAHRVTSKGKGVVLDSASLAPGQSYSMKFTNAGRFNYVDNQHSFMEGTIIVV